MEKQEVTTKYKLDFTKKSPIEYNKIKLLNFWRKILYLKNLVGQDPMRYNGDSFGNLSQRLSYNQPKNKRSFAITGTRTGGLDDLTEKDYTTVLEYYPEENLVVAEGPIKPSREAMTHGTIYDCDDSIRFVFHAHSSRIWRNSKLLQIPTTNDSILYGTPEIAEEVKRLFKDTNVKDRRILSMGGHEDGIITFGKTVDEAGSIMLHNLELSIQHSPH